MSTGLVRENLLFLVACHGSQSALSTMLSPVLTQQKISSMIGGRRYLREHEARHIEQRLRIPSGWMKQCSLRLGMPLVRQFRAMDATTQDLFDALIAFVLMQLSHTTR